MASRDFWLSRTSRGQSGGISALDREAPLAAVGHSRYFCDVHYVMCIPLMRLSSFHLIQKPEQKLAEPRSIRHPVSCFLVLV
jgi:hypothetical protein